MRGFVRLVILLAVSTTVALLVVELVRHRRASAEATPLPELLPKGLAAQELALQELVATAAPVGAVPPGSADPPRPAGPEAALAVPLGAVVAVAAIVLTALAFRVVG